MAENPVSDGAPDTVETSQTNAPAASGPVVMSRRDVRRMERAALRAAAPKVKPVRTVGTLAAVLALIAGVAVPAYAATQPSAETVSLQDAAESEAQSIAVDAAVQTAPLGGAAYSATTPEEIEQAKAEAAAAAAAERAREQAEQAAAEQQQQAEAQQQQQAQVQPAQPQAPQAPQTQTYEAPARNASGICPLPAGSYYVSRSVSSGHEGADMVAPAMTPIYAVKPGRVITSQEALGGWGVVVAIDHGDGTTSLYGHMTYGTRQVQVGDTVSAGQIIGYVGSTGHSTANHLHIEYRINGAIVDPLSYLPI
ncbi:M23 family metallopeptidase [Microbacterium oryzae]|uniref:M23 family metallopeptidase n=1 Tax=Microbacterium oryzae TaxID=743009 RepID=UPI0025B1064D|nr:M23 family metallopeptidase [Microbacterium oryzae]MDN3311037.1 M23 family metallopeptidase [Microbacterium oryzae]